MCLNLTAFLPQNRGFLPSGFEGSSVKSRTSCRPALEKVHGLQFTPRGLEGLLEGLGGFVPAGPQLTDRSRQRSSAARQPQPTKALQSGYHTLQCPLHTHMQTPSPSMHLSTQQRESDTCSQRGAQQYVNPTPPYSAVWLTHTGCMQKSTHVLHDHT